MKILKLVSNYSGYDVKYLEFIDGPETGVGVEYYVRHKLTDECWYVCDDQGEISISEA